MKTSKLTFIYGGPGEEHEVSVKSFQNIYETAKQNTQYEINTIFVDKKGKWDNKKKFDKKEIVWPIIHGKFGEDGQIQKILEQQKIKFIGNSKTCSELTIDKVKTQKILAKNNIKVPRIIFSKENLKIPIIIKPSNNGSSVGLLKYSHENILIQECILGREFICGVIKKADKFIALTPTEIVLEKNQIFDYQKKYNDKTGTIEITPPKNLDIKILKKIQDMALKVHKMTGCRDYSRTDMILNSKNQLVVLEINSVPGLTKASLVPQQLSASGYTLKEFIDIMVKNNS